MVGKVRPPHPKGCFMGFLIHCRKYKSISSTRCPERGDVSDLESQIQKKFNFLFPPPSSSDHHPVVTSQEMPSNHNFITTEYTGTQKCDICRKKVNRELGEPGAIVLCICWCCVCVCRHDLDMDSEVIPCLRVSELWSQMSQKVC